MPARQPLSDADRDLLIAYQRGQLPPADKSRTERLLEQSSAARELFEQLTAGAFPRLPNYTILEQIGKGGFGVVYKAVHHAKERIEAVKVLFGRTPLMTSYFENEVHAIANLRHAHIATLYDAQLSTPPLYYTMEYVEGARLNEFVRTGDVSLARRIEIIAAVAEAIGYAHGQGVVHRDLKPQNILVDAAGEPHIVDFGIAKRLGLAEAPPEPGAEAPQREGAIGTIGYISPEQIAGRPLDARADIFSLGALLFNCITGEPARMARDPAYVRQVLPERGVSRHEDLAAIISRCLRERPEERYGSCDDLIADLRRYVSGRAVRARPTVNPLHHAGRMTTFLLLRWPVTLYATAFALAATLLTVTAWQFTLHTRPGEVRPNKDTALVLFTPSTIDAIGRRAPGTDLPGLSLGVRESLRLLHGALMEKLARAAPTVVVWDYLFPFADDEFDPAFVRGAEALQRKSIPVVVGAASFDVNSEPLISPAIRGSAHACGALLGVKPGRTEDAFEAVLCVARGEEEAPIPTLAVAAYAAARRPDCDPQLRLNTAERELVIRYRLRNPQPEQNRWLTSDKLSFLDLNAETGARQLARSGDRVAVGRVPAGTAAEWASRTVKYEDVLTAGDAQLKRWFDQRAVLIGEAVSGNGDAYQWRGETIFGCEIQARILDGLLGHTAQQSLGRSGLVARVLGWCAAGLFVALLLPVRRWRQPTLATLSALFLVFAGLVFLAWLAILGGSRPMVEGGLATACVLTSFGLAAVVRISRDVLRRRLPAAVTPVIEDSTLPTTIATGSG